MSSIVIQGDTSGSITVEAPSVAGTHTLTLPKATGNIATDATVGLGMKNRIINGDFNIWQRGTSVTTTTVAFGNYTADRWASYRQVAATQVFDTINGKRKSTGKFTLSGGATELYLYQKIEDGNSLNGEEVTLSFYAKGDSAESFGVLARYYDDATQNNEYTTHSTTIALTTSWTKYTITFTADDNTTSTKRNLFLRFNKAAYGGTFIQLTDVQLEVGVGNATPFEYRSYGTELALCQRYYYQVDSYGFINMTTNVYNGTIVKFPVSMRATPTKTIYSTNTGTSGKIYYQDGGTDVNAAAGPPSGTEATYVRASNVSTNVGSNMYFKITADSEL